MNNLRFSREIGEFRHSQFTQTVNSLLLHSFKFSPNTYFDGSFQLPKELIVKQKRAKSLSLTDRRLLTADHDAHFKGVNDLEVDKFDGRFLLSGGADGSVKLWDLEKQIDMTQDYIHHPVIAVPRVRADSASAGHTSGATHVSFSPTTSSYFYTSSYDSTLRLWSSERTKPVTSWNLQTSVNTFQANPLPGAGGLIACATEAPHVQVIDPRSGSGSRAFINSGCAVLSLAWSPVSERTLCSGHTDGTIKVWDSRRFSTPVSKLDSGDFLGITHRFRYALAGESGWGPKNHLRRAAIAHNGGICGLSFSDDGWWLVSVGLDRKLSIWNAEIGAKTLIDLSVPLVQREGAICRVLVTPGRTVSGENQMVLIPNSHEILGVSLGEGDAKLQLRVPGTSRGQKDTPKVQSIAWRGGSGFGKLLGNDMGGRGTGSHGAIYAGYSDGKIRMFDAKLPGSDNEVEEGDESEPGRDRKRKRTVVEEAYRSLMGTKMRFT